MNLDLISSSAVFKNEKAALLNGKGSHAYIIEGIQGIGKMSFALASSCVHFCVSDEKPCFTCPGCRKVLEGIHPDIHIIKPEKNLLRVDQIREVLSTIYETPYEGKSKIYIFQQFHLANEQAQNALLKTLEEPPKSVTFFLLAENALALLPTVRSRCKKLRLTEFNENEILNQLEKMFPQNQRNGYAAKNCSGNIGTAVKLIEDEEFIALNDLADDIIKKLEKPSHAQLGILFEKEKDRLIPLLEILETKFFNSFRISRGEQDLLRIKAVEDALTAKKKNINTGLICDSLAYTLAKGGNKWQR